MSASSAGHSEVSYDGQGDSHRVGDLRSLAAGWSGPVNLRASARRRPTNAPHVTIVVPVFNEEATVGQCIDSVGSQDHGATNLEVIVVDGCSTDATAEVAKAHLDRWGFARSTVVVNEGRSRPANLNRGMAESTGSIICRADGRSRLPQHYVSTCVRLLNERPDVAVVGGRQRALPGDHALPGIGIARALNNRWGMGGATYRRSVAAGPADTVYLGAFRSEQLRAVAGWNEHLGVNEDFDLARRMASRGVVWFDPTLEVGYVARCSFGELASQYFQFGRGKVRYWRRSGDRPRPRQLVAAVGLPVAAIVGLGLFAWPRTRWSTLGVGLVGGALVEVLGGDGPEGPLAAHVLSAVTMSIVAVSWVTGLWAEVVGSAPGTPPAPQPGAWPSSSRLLDDG